MSKTFAFWNQDQTYYQYIKENSDSLLDNSALKQLMNTVNPHSMILDVGCGEGGKLKELQTLVGHLECHGVDISEQGIARAQEQNPHMSFQVGDIETLPYTNDMFDTVFSTFTFEHVTEPQIILDEMIRVCKPGGQVIIVCPNFGSPLYRSPITPRWKHLFRGIARDLVSVFKKPNSIDWYPETPWLDVPWQPDYDTTILPYIYTLKVLYPDAMCSSQWQGSSLPQNPIFKTIGWCAKQLGSLNIYPFRWWGQYLYFEYTKPSRN